MQTLFSGGQTQTNPNCAGASKHSPAAPQVFDSQLLQDRTFFEYSAVLMTAISWLLRTNLLMQPSKWATTATERISFHFSSEDTSFNIKSTHIRCSVASLNAICSNGFLRGAPDLICTNRTDSLTTWTVLLRVCPRPHRRHSPKLKSFEVRFRIRLSKKKYKMNFFCQILPLFSRLSIRKVYHFCRRMLSGHSILTVSNKNMRRFFFRNTNCSCLFFAIKMKPASKTQRFFTFSTSI